MVGYFIRKYNNIINDIDFYNLITNHPGSYMALFCRFFYQVYLHGFMGETVETNSEIKILVDEHACTIETTKKIK